MSAVLNLPVAAGEVAAAIPEREYRRLLGWPRGRELPDDLRERLQGARAWYAAHGRPFVATRRVPVGVCVAESVTLETGDVLASATLAGYLRTGAAHALVVVAASAGPEVADEAARLWVAGCPDEAYFLDRLAAVITEGLLVRASAGLCRDFAPRGERILPHLSPGCGHWDLADQHRLMGLLGGHAGPVTLLPSGALKPQHSVLAAFGVTRRAEAAAVASSSCRRCDLDPCGFRRVSFQRNVLRPSVTP